jgi:hypothetical protein
MDKVQKHNSFNTNTPSSESYEIFWVVTPCGVVVGYQLFGEPCCLTLHFTSFHPEDGGSMDLRNVGILPQHHTAS